MEDQSNNNVACFAYPDQRNADFYTKIEDYMSNIFGTNFIKHSKCFNKEALVGALRIRAKIGFAVFVFHGDYQRGIHFGNEYLPWGDSRIFLTRHLPTAIQSAVLLLF